MLHYLPLRCVYVDNTLVPKLLFECLRLSLSEYRVMYGYYHCWCVSRSRDVLDCGVTVNVCEGCHCMLDDVYTMNVIKLMYSIFRDNYTAVVSTLNVFLALVVLIVAVRHVVAPVARPTFVVQLVGLDLKIVTVSRDACHVHDWLRPTCIYNHVHALRTHSQPLQTLNYN